MRLLQLSWIEKLKERVKKAANSGTAAKILIISIIWSIALIPFWITSIIWFIVSPDTFWQGFAIVALAMCILGPFQFWFAVMAAVLTLTALFSDI